MTEEEAKTKWCPFARPGAVRPEDCGEVRGNRQMDGLIDPGALCIGSACMAWRLVTRIEFRHKHDGSPVKPGKTFLRSQVNEVTVSDGGFCGLAGAPR